MEDKKEEKDVHLEARVAMERIEKQNEKELIRLIAEIIVDATFKDVYEESNTIPEV